MSTSSPGETRPPVSVVMPFAGDEGAARQALATLLSLALREGDELILADNSGLALAADGVTVVPVPGERSPAHARNVGAEHAHGEWILFLDSDCDAPRDLLSAYFVDPVADDVGALAGEIVAAPGAETVAERFGAARSFLSQEAHLAHPFMPRAVTANLMVRRGAFEQVGGFYEGVRAAEDTDFSWRLQQTGWRLELREHAAVEHRYRATIGELRRQWREYAAGRAWLGRRYAGFAPEPALKRALRRRGERLRRRSETGRQVSAEGGGDRRYLALDALLALEELAGFALSNRPTAAERERLEAGVVLVADRFPAHEDPLIDFVRTLQSARVEAVARPESIDPAVARGVRIDYREDDGAAMRALALLALGIRHPIRCGLDRMRRRADEPPLRALAPAVRRLQRDRSVRVRALGGPRVQALAQRLARLAGSQLDETR